MVRLQTVQVEEAEDDNLKRNIDNETVNIVDVNLTERFVLSDSMC